MCLDGGTSVRLSREGERFGERTTFVGRASRNSTESRGSYEFEMRRDGADRRISNIEIFYCSR